MADDDKLRMQEQLNKAMRETQALLEAQAQVASQMLGSFSKLQAIMQSIGQSSGAVADNINDLTNSGDALDELTEKMGEENKAIEEAKKLLEEQGEATGSLNTLMDDLTTKQTKKWLVLGSAIAGAWHGLKFTLNIGRGVLSWAGTLGKVLGQVGLSILAIPFKLLKGLINMQAGGGSNELAQQLEEIRKQFGYLNKTAGGTVVTLARQMKGELANTGLSVWRIFGNLVGRLKEVFEWAKALGPTFDAVSNRIGQGGVEALMAYNKALGLTQEGMKGIAQRALSTGVNINDINQEIANYSLQLADAFGVTMKEVSRDVGNMIADFKNFGHLGVQQLTQVAVYARKLGMEVKALGAIMDKFANFEETATGASQMAQAFGMNIDAMRLMKAQNPAEKLEMIRKAFFATGRSIENMTYQERRLLATQTGLDDASVALAFSTKNQGASYADIKKKGDAARKSQLTQAEAMSKLAGAIERLVKSGSSSNLGFMDQFFAGFRTGIVRTREFRQIMRGLRRSLRATFRAGREVGRAFVHMFPGVSKVFGALRDMFNPARFRVMLRGVVDTFKELFNTLSGRGGKSIPQLMEQLRKHFFDFFNSRSDAGRRFLSGAQDFFKAFATIANFLLKRAIEGITKMVNFAIDLISGRVRLGSMLTAGGDGAMGFLGPIITKLIEGIQPVALKLWEAIKKLFTIVKNKAVDWLKDHWWDVFKVLALPSLTGSLFQTLGTLIGGRIIGGIIGHFKEAGVRVIGNSLGRMLGPSGLGRVAQNIPGASASVQAGQNVAGTVRGAGEVSSAVGDWKGVVLSVVKLGMILLFLTYGLPKLIDASIVAAKAVKAANISTEVVGQTVALMLGVGGMVAAGAVAVKQISEASEGMNWKGLLPSLLALSGVVVLMIGAAAGMIWIMQKFKPTTELIAKTVAIIPAVSAMFIAAAGVSVAATLVGAIGMTGYGLAAIAVGMGILAGTIEIMALQGSQIIAMVNAFNPRPGFVEKTKAFVEIIKGIGSFAVSMAQVIESVKPSILGMILNGESFGSNIDSANEFIRQIINKTKDIIGFIVEKARTVNPSDLDQGARLVALLESVGTFVHALAPPIGVMSSGILESLLESSGSQARLIEFNTYISDLFSNVRITLQTVVDEVRRLTANGNFSESTVKGAQVIKTVLEGLAGFAQGVAPHSSLIERATKAGGGDLSSGLRGVAEYVRVLTRIFISTDFFSTIGQFVSSMANAVSTLSEGQLKSMNIVAGMLKSVFEAVGAVAKVVQSIIGQNNAAPPNPAVIAQIQVMIQSLLGSVSTIIPNVVDGVRSINFGRGEATRIKAKLAIAKDILDLVGRVPEIFEGFKRAAGDNAARSMSGAGIYTTVKGITDAISYLFDRNKHAEAANLQDALKALDQVTFSKGINGKLATVKSLFETLTKFSEIAPAITSMTTNLTAMETLVRERTVARVGDSVAAMVSQVNSTTNALNGLSPINIQVPLRRIVSNLGLQDSGRFEIQNRNFTIQVNVDVTMRADALQEALIETSNRTRAPHRRLTHTNGV